MRTILFCVMAALAACGGGGSDGGDDGGDDGGGDDGGSQSADFDEEVGGFIDAYCAFSESCAGRDLDSCLTAVEDEMALAKEELDEDGQGLCADCMALTAQIIDSLGVNDCEISEAQREMLDAACGTFNEQCAGYPSEE
jgi:hypothetical protein